MEQKIPIETVHLFPQLDKQLIDLLRSLSPEEWFKPTIAKKWTVKDIAAHLLDGNIRTLCLSRDKHILLPPNPINNYRELVDYLNELNAQWVTASKRISPKLLIEELENTGKEFCDYLATLAPFDDAIFSVAWAGETVSKNWFHIAREYSEKFIHQLQIRDAVNRPGLLTKELFYPFIDTFISAWPHTYRNIDAPQGTTIRMTVTTEIGGNWFLRKEETGWSLSKQNENDLSVTVDIDPETAWKLFSKGIGPDVARQAIKITGDEKLASPTLQMISVMA